MEDNSALLKLHQIEKRYHGRSALADVSLDFYPGEITALAGDNGAGKSSLVKIIAGYHGFDSGALYWQGNRVHFNPLQGPRQALNLGIQTVWQDLGLIDGLPLWRNFFLGHELVKGRAIWRRLDIASMRQITAEILTTAGLTDHNTGRGPEPDTPAGSLSGGQRQMLAICRACYFKARLLILDEPTSALSIPQSDRVLRLITEIADTGLSVIFISHRKEHMLAIADRIVVLHQGRVVINRKNQYKGQTPNQIMPASDTFFNAACWGN